MYLKYLFQSLVQSSLDCLSLNVKQFASVNLKKYLKLEIGYKVKVKAICRNKLWALFWKRENAFIFLAFPLVLALWRNRACLNFLLDVTCAVEMTAATERPFASLRWPVPLLWIRLDRFLVSKLIRAAFMHCDWTLSLFLWLCFTKITATYARLL